MDAGSQKKRKLDGELAYQDCDGQFVGPQLPLAGGATHAERVELLEQKLRHLRSWMAQLQRTLEGSNQIAVQNSRRLFIGGLPVDVTQDELVSCLEDAISQSGAGIAPGKAITFCRIQSEKNFAFIELRSAEEATNVISLDGICMRGSIPLKIKRPSKFDAATALMLGPQSSDPTINLQGLIIHSHGGSSAAPQGKYEHNWNTLYVGNLPTEWSEQQVSDFLQQYGSVKYLRLTLDKETKVSKGYAFAEFSDDASTSEALTKLNGLLIGSRTITVNRLLEHKAQQQHMQQQQQQRGMGSTMGGPMGGNMGQAGAMGINTMQGGLGIGAAAGTAGTTPSMQGNLAAAMNQGSMFGGQLGGQLGQMGGMMGVGNMGMMGPPGAMGIGMGMGLSSGGMMQPQQPGMMGTGMMSAGNTGMAPPAVYSSQQAGGLAGQIDQTGYSQQQMGQIGYGQQQFAPQMGGQQGLLGPQQHGMYNQAQGVLPGMGMTGNALPNNPADNKPTDSYPLQGHLQQQQPPLPAMPVPPSLGTLPSNPVGKDTNPAVGSSAAAAAGAMLGSQQMPTSSQGLGAAGSMSAGAWSQTAAGYQQQQQPPQFPTFPNPYMSYNSQM